MNFVKNLRETTIEYINKLAAQSAQIEVLDHDRADYKQSTYLDKRRDLVKQQEDILNEGRYKILDVVNGYKQDLTVRYCAKGGDITDDAKLFTGNIPLAQGDIEALVDKYTAVDNMTMLRMIFDYASNHDIYIDRAYYTEEMRAQAADVLGETMSGALTSDMTGAFVQNDSFFYQSMVPPALAGE